MDAILTPNIIKSRSQAEGTIRARSRIDRGFLTRRWTLAVVIIAVVAACLNYWIVFAALVAVLAVDFAVFCVRRTSALRRNEAGSPRITSLDDWRAVSAAFFQAGLREPTMDDWHAAAHMTNHQAWRQDARYHEVTRYYSGGVVADIGCGDGALLRRYGICQAADYIGIDPGADLVRQMQEETGARGVVGTAESTHLPRGSVDFVVCSESFEHLPDPGAAMREFCRILRPGGLILIQSPNATRMRNVNPFHLACCCIGVLAPRILMRAVVIENTWLHAYTFHWDFTRQDIASYIEGLPLTIEKINGVTYRFNPHGNLPNRIAARLSRRKFCAWAWWDLTILLRRGPDAE